MWFDLKRDTELTDAFITWGFGPQTNHIPVVARYIHVTSGLRTETPRDKSCIEA